MDTKNRMLIDAAHPEETRVVVLRNNRVEEFDYESAQRKQLRGNIYLAKVTRVEPSLQAAFAVTLANAARKIGPTIVNARRRPVFQPSDRCNMVCHPIYTQRPLAAVLPHNPREKMAD